MLNLCYCGTQDGYPHTPDCPRPLYRASTRMAEDWQRERDALQREEENARYGQLMDANGNKVGKAEVTE